ncbi:MAG: GIY-YIG nuclease family protein [Lachnospiraceae bacterium]|nr:GIY-YIG nuclease family protein [Lachnospiraceae bacterium]
MAYGKSIELFLANGTADSLIIAELSNWNGKAIKIPRIEVMECKRSDIKEPGVYFLFCKEEDNSDSVYIGESENVKERLVQHIRDYSAEKEKYYWTTAVIFIGRDLNKAHIRYLEDKLVTEAKSAKRYTVLTKNTYSKTVLKESQIATMDEFIDNIKILINTLGYKVLEPMVINDTSAKADDEKLHMSAGNARAEGMVTIEGFVLLAGAIINEKVSEKSLTQSAIALRKKIFDSGKVHNLTTTEDILFSSSSAAADFVTGYSVSGPMTWKNAAGKTLKEIESEASNEERPVH